MSNYNPATGEFDFAQAIKSMRLGRPVYRSGWGSKSGIEFVGLHIPSKDEPMNQPYLFMQIHGGTKVPWSPNNTDVLAVDWLEVF